MFNAGQRTIESEAAAGRLAPVVGDQMQVMRQGVADAVGEAVVDGHFKGIQPIVGLGLDAEAVTDYFLGVPVQDDGEVEPAPGVEFNFGHVDAPVLIGARCSRFSPEIAAFGLEAIIGLDGQIILLHEPLNAVFADFVPFSIIKILPDETVAPEGVIFFDFADMDQMFLVLFDAFEGSASFHSS